MKKHLYTDQQLLEMMDADINAGTAALFEAYGGLVWSACGRRLKDPEDIKECVNDTFVDFSRQYRRFDPDQGSLSNYLCTIALRRATECYRRNQAAARKEAKYRDAQQLRQEDAAEFEELETALDQLDPVDARILRDKYYNSMTYQEIAAAMGLPYDTVRKRGQRNLKKLRFILIGLILALLAAGCAYIILRSFQFAEGAGPNFDPDRPIYKLTDVEGSPYVLENGTFFVEDAIYQDGQLFVKVGVLSPGNWPEINVEDYGWGIPPEYMFNEYLSILFNIHATDAAGTALDGQSGSRYHDSDGKAANEHLFLWEADETADALTVQVALSFLDPDTVVRPDLSDHSYVDVGLLTPEDADKIRSEPAQWTITLEKLDFQEEGEAGTFYNYLDTGFMVRDGVAYPGGSYVSLYPYQSETAYTLSQFLTRGYTGTYDDRTIALVAADGTRYSSRGVFGGSSSALMERQIYFPEAPAGGYTLEIPYLCVSKTEETASVTVELPTGLGQTLPLDETVYFADGSGIHLTGVSYQRSESPGAYTEQDGTFVQRIVYIWSYVFEFELISKAEMVLTDFHVSNTVPLAAQTLQGSESRGRGAPNTFAIVFDESNNGHRGIYQEGGDYEMTLSFHTPTYILDQPIEIPVAVYESEHDDGWANED